MAQVFLMEWIISLMWLWSAAFGATFIWSAQPDYERELPAEYIFFLLQDPNC